MEKVNEQQGMSEKMMDSGREALQNMLAAFDNPIARRKLGGEFAQEAIASAREALESHSMPAAGSDVESWRDQLQRKLPHSNPEHLPYSLIVAAMGREIGELRALLASHSETVKANP